MKIALVHELLTMRGGAEKVLRVLAGMFPDAPIYTLLYDETKLGDWFPRERVRPSRLQRFAGFLEKPLTIFNLQHSVFNHHLYLRRFPAAVEAWDFSEFDIVLSTSSAFAHGIITNGKPLHLCYVHSPARYLWDRTHDVLERAGRGLLGPLRRAYLERTFHRLRIWDAECADRPDVLLAASKEVQRRIELYWRRESDVLYPPIDDTWFESSKKQTSQQSATARSYFFLASTLVAYKRIELAIEACNRGKFPLKIAGEGPARGALERIAGPTIEFLGYQPTERLRELYASAAATLFPGDEDFGLVPIESQACGTPIIAFRGGGALETVVEGETGAFFDQPTADSLLTAMRTFDRSRLDAHRCREQAGRFSRSAFEDTIRARVERVSAPHFRAASGR